MGNTVMFMTIGMRDYQLVYKDAVKGNYRWSAPICDEKAYRNLRVYSPKNLREDKHKKDDKSEPIGICFPMLAKACAYLKDKGVGKLDYLFLIATNRKELLKKLEQIQALKENAEQIDEEYNYLEQGLIKHAKDDCTSNTAHLIQHYLEGGNKAVPDLEISKVQVLDLGTYGFFDPILNADLKKEIGIDLLKRADINVLDFFQSECFNALTPYFSQLEEAKLYLALNAGGMPQMQRGVNSVLRSCIAHADYEQIYSSEFLWYQMESQPQESFLTMQRQMTDNVICLDWDSAYIRFLAIKEQHPNKLSPQQQKELDKLFQQVLKFRRTENKHRWFQNFCTLIFQALYRMNLNDVLVWLKCLEEAAYDALLKKQCGILWDKVGEEKVNHHKRKYVYHKFGNTEAFPDKLTERFDEATLLKAFAPYAKVFMSEACFSHNNAWDNLRKKRNKLIHEGITVSSIPGLSQDILKFIDIKLKDLNNAIAEMQAGNLEKLISFEQKCLNNRFFAPLREIGGMKDKDSILHERQQCKNYIQALHAHKQ